MYNMIYDEPYNIRWTTNNPVVDLFTHVRSQVVDFVISTTRAINLRVKIDANLIEEEINICSVVVSTYERDGYLTLKPYSISVECLSENEFLGIFQEAEISFSGETLSEAINAVKVEVIEIYKLYKTAEKLGPRPKSQLAALEKYVGKKTG